MGKLILTILLTVALAGLPLTLSAAPVLISQGKPVTGSAYYDYSGETFPYTNVNDGRYNDTGEAYNWSFWLTPDYQTGWFIIDLGGLYTVSRFIIQNTHNRYHNDRGGLDFDIAASTDGTSYTTVLDNTLTFYDSSYDPIPKQTFDIGDATARYVRFDLKTYYGYSGGINELEVYGVVPLPGAFFLLGGGLAGLAAVGLRKRRT